MDAELDDNHWNTLQEILNALGNLPGVYDRVDAYMRGRGIEDPAAEIDALRKVAFASAPATPADEGEVQADDYWSDPRNQMQSADKGRK